MAREINLDERIRNNIGHYKLQELLGERTNAYCQSITETFGIAILIIGRQGETMVKTGKVSFENVQFNENEGKMIRVQGRTMGQLYGLHEDGTKLNETEQRFIEALRNLLERMAGQTYFQKESTIYIDLIENNANPGTKLHEAEKLDGLTGVFHGFYFRQRMQVVDRSQVLPVGCVILNINDWKYHNEHYGDDESDRLIQVIAEFTKKEAKEGYIIGRTDGDVLEVMIPMAQDNEAEEFAKRVQDACNAYEDERLAPSVAVGVRYKNNVEQSIEQVFADAEYDMFENKYEIKNAPGYVERLHKGV